MSSENTGLSWRAERREDRRASAEIARADADAAAQRQRKDRQAHAVQQATARARRAVRRSGRRAAVSAWLARHTIDLLFVPVVVVPGALAWTAMSAFGVQVFGPIGHALPAFSEGSMWAFAVATTLRLRDDPDAPVWHLRLGTAVFAAGGAALNFIHGVTPAGRGVPRGPGIGAVMAVVSVAGVVVHQLVTAGPRSSREERCAARAGRAVARRREAIARAALARATADLDSAGRVRLVYKPGWVTVARHWTGRLRLADVPHATGWSPLVALSSTLPAAPFMRLSMQASDPDGDTAPVARPDTRALLPLLLLARLTPARATAAGLDDGTPERAGDGTPPPSADGSQAIGDGTPPAVRQATGGPPEGGPDEPPGEVPGVPSQEADGESLPEPPASPPDRVARPHATSHQPAIGVPMDADSKKARRLYRESLEAAERGERAKPLTDRALAAAIGKGRGRTWAANRIAEVDAGPQLAASSGS